MGRRHVGAVLAAALIGASAVSAAAPLWPDAVVGDAIPDPLTDRPGDPARGRALVLDRTRSLCLLCHSGPFPEQTFQGNLSPDLAGTGSRWSVGQLRLKLVDPRRTNADTIMPAFYATEGLSRVGATWRGKTILSAQEIEDVVAFLVTLREGPQETRE